MKKIIAGFAGILTALAVQAELLSPPGQPAGVKRSAALMAAYVPDNVPATATWVGAGDRTNVNAPANWDCYNASGARLDGAWPTADTAITISGATTFNVPAGQTLNYKTLSIGDVELAADCDWRGLGAGVVINGTVDVKGHTLSVAVLKGSGTVTDTAAPTPLDEGGVACGELHVEVPSGTTLENTTVTLAGALKLVKDGAGTLKASKAGQGYTGGTDVAAGGITLGTNNGPVGPGNGSCTVSVAAGATFDFNGLMHRDSCRYHFVLGGGTVKLQGVALDQSWNAERASIASVTLLADSTLSGKHFYFGHATEQVPLTFNGHTLNLDVPSNEYVHMRLLKAEDAGTILAYSGWFEFQAGSDLTKANVIFRNDTYMTILDATVALGGFAYERNYWGDRNVDPPRVTVAGNYQVGANRPAFTLLSGATLDFKAWPVGQIWNPAGSNPSKPPKYTAYYSDPGLVTFAANGNFFVDVGDRAFPHEWTQLVAWSAKPTGAIFKLVSEAENELLADDTGLYIKNATEVDINTIPATATWVGAGDRTNVNAPANWDCYNALGARLDGAWPTADTAITVSGPTTFNVPAGQTLNYKTLTIGDVELAADCDWRGLGAWLVINGTVDVKGHRLSVAVLKGSGTVTDTAAPTPLDEGGVACGELHVEVPPGTTLENTTVTLAGALKLVKDGPGTLKASKAGQSYTGGTDVTAGGITLGTNNGPVGPGNGSCTVSVAAGATFDFNGLMNRDSCRYHFVLGGGTVKLQEVVQEQSWNAARASIASVTLLADSTLSGKFFFFGHETEQVPLTFNGHTLNLDVPSGQYVHMRSLKAEDAGTILANSGWFEFKAGSDLTKANVIFRNDAYMTILEATVALGGFSYATNYWGDRNVDPPRVTVAGNYQVGANRPAFTLLSGATLDFKTWPVGQIWDPAGSNPPKPLKYLTCYSETGLVTFADNGNFFVDVGDRVFPPHVWTQLVAWSAKPTGATFELVSEAENELLADDTGLYVRDVSEVDDNTPVTATWVGEGDWANVNAPANWDCRNVKNERLDGAVPTTDTAITISGATTFNVPAGQTLVYSVLTIGNVELTANCDWRGLGAGLVIGGTVDVKGHTLSVAALKGSGTVTDTAEPDPQGACGELHVEVPPGTTLENTTVTLAGALKLVKEGPGTLKATKAGQSYAGGTDVAEGGITLGTNNSPTGSGDGTRTVSVAAGATFDFGDQIRTDKTICRYHFVLDGGTVKLVGTGMATGWTAACGPFASVTLNADSTLRGYHYFLGNASTSLPVTFNGHTLTLDGTGGNRGADNFNYILSERIVAMDAGTLLLKGVWVSFTYEKYKLGKITEKVDLSRANLVCREDGWFSVLYGTMDLAGFAYDWEKWHGRFADTHITVAGSYEVGVNRPPFTLLSGATLDFKTWPAGQVWDPAGVPASQNGSDTYYTVPGLVTFAENGNFIVDVGEKRYSREPTKLVTWAKMPTGATFTLAPASKKMNNLLQVQPDGLYIIYDGGTTIFVR